MKAMEINGLSALINMPPAPKGKKKHQLPPYDVQQVFDVDEYEGCPDNWMHGSDKASSYFLPVKPGHHIWLDFNRNWSHSHHVAIVISIQGINPITGAKTSKLELEQYRDKCPKHDTPFSSDRFCEKCKFQWPTQNYMTTTSCPHGLLWIDGWRAQSGEIRGFLVTEETMRGVASQLIGNDRVFAIGIGFFLSKEHKNRIPENPLGLGGHYKHTLLPPHHGEPIWKYEKMNSIHFGDSPDAEVYSVQCSSSPDSVTYNASAESLRGMDACRTSMRPKRRKITAQSSRKSLRSTKKLEIGGGAKIEQELSYLDENSLDFWQPEPAGMIYINYCAQRDFDEIMKLGKKDLTNGGEGFLGGLKVGND